MLKVTVCTSCDMIYCMYGSNNIEKISTLLLWHAEDCVAWIHAYCVQYLIVKITVKHTPLCINRKPFGSASYLVDEIFTCDYKQINSTYRLFEKCLMFKALITVSWMHAHKCFQTHFMDTYHLHTASHPHKHISQHKNYYWITFIDIATYMLRWRVG